MTRNDLSHASGAGGARTLNHEMRVAFPSRKTARRMGINRNHHVRVWCTCMDNPIRPPGSYAGTDPSVVNDRSVYQAINDPRRLGNYDELGYVDVRQPNSALDLWRAHVRAATESAERRSA